jgi:hypothetical protein
MSCIIKTEEPGFLKRQDERTYAQKRTEQNRTVPDKERRRSERSRNSEDKMTKQRVVNEL